MSNERELYSQDLTIGADPPQGAGWVFVCHIAGDLRTRERILWVREPQPDAWQERVCNAGDSADLVSSYCPIGFEPMGPWKPFAASRYADMDTSGLTNDCPQTHWRRPLRRVGGAQ